METVYGSHDDVYSSSSGTVSERVQSLASNVYHEFEVMMSTYGDGVIKNLMPQVVTILESLNQAYREKQEHEVELELLHVENDNLKVQFEREKQLRKTNEQRYIESEDTVDEERKTWSQKVQSLEIEIRGLEIKLRNVHEHVTRQDERESELRDENLKLHTKYSELFKTHVDYVERTRPSTAENIHRVSPSTTASTTISRSQCPSQNESKQRLSASALEETAPPDTTDVSDLFKADSGVVSSVDTVNDAVHEVDLLRSSATSSQKPLVISSDVSTASGDVTSEARTSEVDTQQSVASSPQPQSVIDTDVGSHVNDVGCDTRTDYEHDHDDEFDTGLDESLYQDCISAASFVGEMPALHSAEFDDIAVNLVEDDSRMTNEGHRHSDERLNMSVYDELAGHSAAVLGEIDSGAELIVTGVSTAVENLIIENNELLATKNALNIVKDDLIAKLDELTGDIDLLKEQNYQLQKTIDEKSAKVVAVEEELKKARESKVDSETHFTRVDLMRVLIERNQYKERLIELQDAVRRADMARAAAKQQAVTKPTKKRSSVWGFFGELIHNDSTSESSSWSGSRTDGATDSTVI